MSQLFATFPLTTLEQCLMNRQPLPPKSFWERETGRGVTCKFGEYRFRTAILSNNEKQQYQEEEIVIDEDCSSIATRVWDCAALTTKWFEAKATNYPNRCPPNLREAFGIQTRSHHHHNDPDRPIHVLELGAGLGLLSICLAKMGAAVLSTEYGAAVRYLQESCEKNNVTLGSKNYDSDSIQFEEEEVEEPLTAGFVKCRELDWFKTEETLETLFLPGEVPIFDLIVVTDCTLSNMESCGVIDMIHRYGTKGHTKVVAGACVEREGTTCFIRGLQKEFENVMLIPTSDHHPDFRTPRHQIIMLTV